MPLTLRSFLDTIQQLRTRHRRRLAFLAPALERRRPRIAAEDYAARHSIEHTLDRKAELRRLAPTKPEAAQRYRQLLLWELEGLREMVSVLKGTVDDGWNGTLGWFWVACALTTLVLAFVTRAALKERAYSAVMAATGLLYLAILTAFGTDLVARAVLRP